MMDATMRNGEGGFTLIELVVVMTLLGLMLFYTLPRFDEAMTLDKSRKFSRWLILKTKTLKEKALQEKKRYILHIGMESGKVWVSDESMSEETLLTMEENGHDIPEDLRVVDVEYPEKGQISAGTADICFYKNGYSDKVLIHLEDDDNNQTTFLIEPFLSKVKIYEEHVGFEG